MFHILSNSNLFLGLFENDITAKMAYFGPSFHLSPFAATFSHPLPPKNLQTFLPKSNYKIHFVTCMMLHITNLPDCSRDKYAKPLGFNELNKNKIITYVYLIFISKCSNYSAKFQNAMGASPHPALKSHVLAISIRWMVCYKSVLGSVGGMRCYS